jgi:hypothetical protein
MRKKAVQQGRSEQRGEAYSMLYVEPLSEARTPLAAFFRILLVVRLLPGRIWEFGETFEADESASFSAIRDSNFIHHSHMGAGLGGLGPDFRCGCGRHRCRRGGGWLHDVPFVSTAKRSSGYQYDVHTLDLSQNLVNQLTEFFAQGVRYATDLTHRKAFHCNSDSA